jgi:Leucine-rich repeat (LRR) protein
MKLNYLTFAASIILNFTFVLLSDAQNITFIEDEFKSELIAQGFDTNGNGEISITEANLITVLELRSLDISTLADLNHFQNLVEFTSSFLLEIEAIELKNFQHLKSFSFENRLGVDKSITIEIENLPQLESFTLKTLITELKFDTLPNLRHFEVINKSVSNPFYVNNFNLSNLPNVEEFVLDKCRISHLSFSENTELKRLTVSHSTLSTINLNENTKLQYLDLSSSNISSIDLSQNLELEKLDLNFNWLNNTFHISDLPKLKYINVSNNGLTNLNFENLDSLEILNANGNNIESFDQTYLNLLQLHIIGNDMDEIDAIQFPKLQELYCADIKAENLNLSDFSELRIVGCGGEILQEITFGENPKLEYVGVGDSNLSEFQITDKPLLTEISLYRNEILEEVTLHNLPMLDDVSVYVNNVNYFDAKELNHLSSLRLESNNLSSIDLSGIHSIDDLNLGSNAFTSFSLGVVTIIKELDLDNNPLTNLDFDSIKEIPTISLYNTLLSNINLSQSTTTLLRIDRNPNLDTLILKNGVFTGVNNSGWDPTILDTPNLKYICIDSSEQDMMQTIVDQSGISPNIEIECEGLTTSLNENSLEDIKVYPNPAVDEFYIRLAGKNIVSIFNSYGQLILNETMNEEIEVCNLNAGYYFIHIFSITDGKRFSSKIIIEK